MTTIVATNISPEKSKDEINRFFSFCGKTKSVDITEGDTLTATVTYESHNAYKTALLLNNSQFGPTSITVAPASGVSAHDDVEDEHVSSYPSTDNETGEFKQEDKPRSRILAEYLAHGYVIGDVAVSKALELDAKAGVSSRFFAALQNLDKKLHATDKAKAADNNYGVTQKAGFWFGGLSSYFEKATNTPTGQKIANFYTEGQRQVADVHNEARRLAELKKDAAGGSAVKAAGLEKVLGAEKPADSTPSHPDTTTGTASAVPMAAVPGIPATQPIDDVKM